MADVINLSDFQPDTWRRLGDVVNAELETIIAKALAHYPERNPQ